MAATSPAAPTETTATIRSQTMASAVLVANPVIAGIVASGHGRSRGSRPHARGRSADARGGEAHACGPPRHAQGRAPPAPRRIAPGRDGARAGADTGRRRATGHRVDAGGPRGTDAVHVPGGAPARLRPADRADAGRR